MGIDRRAGGLRLRGWVIWRFGERLIEWALRRIRACGAASTN
jgi:hypothetical protein